MEHPLFVWPPDLTPLALFGSSSVMLRPLLESCNGAILLSFLFLAVQQNFVEGLDILFQKYLKLTDSVSETNNTSHVH